MVGPVGFGLRLPIPQDDRVEFAVRTNVQNIADFRCSAGRCQAAALRDEEPPSREGLPVRRLLEGSPGVASVSEFYGEHRPVSAERSVECGAA